MKYQKDSHNESVLRLGLRLRYSKIDITQEMTTYSKIKIGPSEKQKREKWPRREHINKYTGSMLWITCIISPDSYIKFQPKGRWDLQLNNVIFPWEDVSKRIINCQNFSELYKQIFGAANLLPKESFVVLLPYSCLL